MLDSLEIRGYRGFKEFRITKLGRVNLLVGGNSSGKTTVLEAVELLWSGGRSPALWRIGQRRGETQVVLEEEFREISHLTALALRYFFNSDDLTEMTCEISGRAESQLLKWTGALTPGADPLTGGYRLLIQSENRSISVDVEPDLSAVMRLPPTTRGDLFAVSNLQVVGTSGITPQEVRTLFSSIALSSDEDTVLDAMRLLEPRLSRLAILEGSLPTRSHIVLRMGAADRMPIGILGDGIWRVLGLILKLVNARGGTLIVDEIDTGLHHSVMVKVWKMILETAKRLDVQVFATTHSLDCVRAFEPLSQGRGMENSEAFIHRIDREQLEATTYSEKMISYAIQDDLEVR